MGRDPQQIRNMSPLFVPTLARKPSSNMAFLVSDKAEFGENLGGSYVDIYVTHTERQ